MTDKTKFIKIIKEHEGIIYKITRVYTNNDEDQKDLYQEIVYQLWKSFESFKGNSKMSTWIYKVALNTSITHTKKEKKSGRKIELDFSIYQFINETDNVKEERLNILYKHIHELNIIEKGIILLYLEGKNYEEIANITGFTKTNVSTKLSRIKIKLKNKIKKV